MLTKGGLTARFKGVTGIEIAISSKHAFASSAERIYVIEARLGRLAVTRRTKTFLHSIIANRESW